MFSEGYAIGHEANYKKMVGSLARFEKQIGDLRLLLETVREHKAEAIGDEVECCQRTPSIFVCRWERCREASRGGGNV